MKRTQGLTQEEIMQSYQLANKALRNYVFRLEEKIANYESLLKHCPRFRSMQDNNESAQRDVYDAYYEDLDEELEDEEWDGLEESDFEDEWEEDEFLEED